MGIELFVLAPVFLGGFVVLVVLAIVFGVRQQRQRRESLAAFAASIGWRYEANAVHLATRWRGTPFGRGSSRAVRHVLTGEIRGRQAAVLEYSFVTGSGIVHPRFMEYMMAGPADPLRIEGTDAWTWHEERLDTTQSHARLSRLADIVDMIPRYVWQDYGHAAPTGTVGA